MYIIIYTCTHKYTCIHAHTYTYMHIHDCNTDQSDISASPITEKKMLADAILSPARTMRGWKEGGEKGGGGGGG